jgi:hypothetical protein
VKLTLIRWLANTPLLAAAGVIWQPQCDGIWRRDFHLAECRDRNEGDRKGNLTV